MSCRLPIFPAVQRLNAQHPDNPLSSAPVAVSWDLETAGQWIELGNGDRLWLLQIHSKGASGLAVLYDHFYIPPGGKVFMYEPEGEAILGAYSSKNNKTNGHFVTGFIPGETAILEYYEPKFQRGKGKLSIFRVDYAITPDIVDAFGTREAGYGFGESDSCQVNVNCPVGADWQDEKRGVTRIRMVLEEGMGWCSGSLVNNTNNDGTPYVLTGFHCQDGYTPLYDFWRFDFQYEGATCDDPAQEPGYYSIVGSMERAGRQASDFLLLEISIPIPAFFNVYFNGWDRSAAPPSAGVYIHHPKADIKKISFDNNPLVIHPSSLNWSNGVTTPANHHFRVVLDIGSFQVGSSGSPLFNGSGHIVGQLHGGFLGCTQVTTFSGRFSISWNEGATSAERLKEWLDPNNSGVMVLDGYQPPVPASAGLSGRVKTSNTNKGVAGVTVICFGPDTLTQVTDTTGAYSFTNLPNGENYYLACVKNTGLSQGVTTLDLVFIKKHILLLELLNGPFAMIAADANKSGSITTLDMVEITKVILGISTAFPNNSSWRFIPTDYVFPDPLNPFFEPIPNAYGITSLTMSLEDLDFYGVKVGDANLSVNPYQ
ncbi:MAG: hypothetical protein IPJ40_04420 [Saprospirales bacterium]|nr:hypothetical protein [Saprospirales bacterium]